MRPEQVSYMAKIDAHVAAYQVPECASIAEDTHIFHFERDGDWRDAEILFVNKNGHHFRVYKQAGGEFLFAKTWNGIFDTQSWMTEAGLKRMDPEELIRLCGSGPQGKVSTETLCLLPKGTTHRRRAVWRGTMLKVHFDINANRFTVTTPLGESATFDGKMWESKEAARWCLASIAPNFVPTAHKADVKANDAAFAVELESSEMWGMF